MRRLLMTSPSAFALAALAAEPGIDIDPNTKIQGGADVRSSGANAQSDDSNIENKPRVAERGNVAGPDKSGPEKDKPIKPQ